MTAFNPGDGWELGVTGPSRSGEEYIEHVVGGEYRRWFRTHPVPALPTEPYTVIRVMWRPGAVPTRTQELTLYPEGAWGLNARRLTPTELLEKITDWEPLAEPRSLTAKAVMERLETLREGDGEDWREQILREFGVES